MSLSATSSICVISLSVSFNLLFLLIVDNILLFLWLSGNFIADIKILWILSCIMLHIFCVVLLYLCIFIYGNYHFDWSEPSTFFQWFFLSVQIVSSHTCAYQSSAKALRSLCRSPYSLLVQPFCLWDSVLDA